MLRLVSAQGDAVSFPEPWSSSDLAECYRCAEILARHGIPVDIEHGTTDEGDPWLVMVPCGREDAVIHAARIDGKVIVVSEPLSIRTSGFTLREALRRCLDDDRFRACFTAASKLTAGGSVLLHPVTILLALVMLTVVVQNEAQAAPEVLDARDIEPARDGAGIATLLARLLPPAAAQQDHDRVHLAPRAEAGPQQPQSAARHWAPMDSAILAAAFAFFMGAEDLAERWSASDAGPLDMWRLPAGPLDRTAAGERGVEQNGTEPEASWHARPFVAVDQGSVHGHAAPASPIVPNLAYVPGGSADIGTERERAVRAEGVSEPVRSDATVARAPDEPVATEPHPEGRSTAEGGAVSRLVGPIELREAPQDALLSREMQAALQRLLAEEGRAVGLHGDPLGGTASPARIDLKGNGSLSATADALAQFVLWLTDARNQIVLPSEMAAQVSAIIEVVFSRSVDVQKVLIVDDGPQTIWPYRLTSEIGIMSVDYLVAGSDLEQVTDSQYTTQAILLGLPTLGEVVAIGWIAV